MEKHHILDDDIYLYLIVNRKTHTILDSNHLAKNYYYSEEKAPDLFDLFPDHEILSNPLSNLDEEESVRLFGVPSKKVTGETFICDVEICYTDRVDDIIFFVIKDRKKDKDSDLNDLVELIDNPVFVLNWNEHFTVRYGNYKFYQCIRQTKRSFHEKFHSSYVALLDNSRKIAFAKAVFQQLQESRECHVDIEVTYDEEYYHLYHFNAFHSSFDGKLYGVLISVRNQSDLMKKIEYDQQYIDIMQEFSKDLLFRIDVQKKLLIHRGVVSHFQDLTSEMENFPESIRDKKWIHPEDLEGYIVFAEQMMHGQGAVYDVRFQLTNGNYEKYRLQGKPLFDEKGKAVQVIGKAENIQHYVEIESKAYYDKVTATLDKQSFYELVNNILSRSVQKDRFALLFLEFDEFTMVREKMGDHFADFVLEVAGRRILNSTRNLDKVGRVGSAEFVIFFHHAPNDKAILDRAEAVLHSLRRDFHDGALTHSLVASIGIAVYPNHGRTFEELFKKADRALTRSKYLGKDIAKLYSEDLED